MRPLPYWACIDNPAWLNVVAVQCQKQKNIEKEKHGRRQILSMHLVGNRMEPFRSRWCLVKKQMSRSSSWNVKLYVQTLGQARSEKRKKSRELVSLGRRELHLVGSPALWAGRSGAVLCLAAKLYPTIRSQMHAYNHRMCRVLFSFSFLLRVL